MVLSAGTRLGPYEILAELGRGGMGVVYQARDPRLDRRVAIKVLPSDLTRDTTAKQRFLQEAKAASALDHPNICNIHAIDETPDGQLYLVMAYYDGETLKQRIERGALPIDDAIDLAAQVGRGLAEAHGAGIVHRDIKPANLLVTESGVVKILDFGLAKLAGSEAITQTGTTLGTVAYMSPEQLRGEEVDHRSDIWSLGVVLFEMLAARRPFKGEQLEALSVGILQAQPLALTSLLPGATTELERSVSRTLTKSRDERYQAVTDLLTDLQAARETQAAPTVGATSARHDEVPSIAVLPFTNMSADPEQEYFCDGLAEELIDALARLEGLRVVARTSAFQFKGQAHDLRKVGEQLNVKTVLEGSVRKAGNRLRINAQLINAADGYHLWSERYDREMDDVFAVQDEIAGAVVEKLKVRLLGPKEAPLVQAATSNLEAYNLYLKGQFYLLQFTRDALLRSLDCFMRAVAEEPRYAQGHAGIALVQAVRAVIGFDAPRSVMPEAKAAAHRAVEIDDTVADAHVALAYVRNYDDWDWPGADREYRRALELNPGDASCRMYYAFLLTCLGRADAAVAEARQAVEIDPLSGVSNFAVAQALVCGRRFDAAIQQSRTTIERAPTYHAGYVVLGQAAALTGNHGEAVAALRQAVTYAPRDGLSRGYLGWALGLAGQRDAALQILDEVKQERDEAYFSAWLISLIHVGLGEHDEAVRWLQQAFEDRDGLLPWLNAFQLFDPLRSDPRFQDLLRRMSFPQATGAA